jgi:hypothetical protein
MLCPTMRHQEMSFLLKDSLVPRAVSELGLEEDCRFYQWLMKNSKHFTDDEMKELARIIEESNEESCIRRAATAQDEAMACVTALRIQLSSLTISFMGDCKQTTGLCRDLLAGNALPMGQYRAGNPRSSNFSSANPCRKPGER